MHYYFLFDGSHCALMACGVAYTDILFKLKNNILHTVPPTKLLLVLFTLISELQSTTVQCSASVDYATWTRVPNVFTALNYVCVCVCVHVRVLFVLLNTSWASRWQSHSTYSHYCNPFSTTFHFQDRYIIIIGRSRTMKQSRRGAHSQRACLRSTRCIWMWFLVLSNRMRINCSHTRQSRSTYTNQNSTFSTETRKAALFLTVSRLHQGLVCGWQKKNKRRKKDWATVHFSDH